MLQEDLEENALMKLSNMSLFSLVTSALRSEEHERQANRTPPDYFYDSGAGSCLRKRVLQRAKKEKLPPTDADLLAFRAGNLLHDWIRTLLIKNGAIPTINGVALAEQSVNTEGSHGRYDFLLDPEKTGRYTLVDVKSTSSYGFKKRMEEGVDLTHAMQLCRYWMKLKDQYDIERGVVWYLSKDPKPGLTDLECPVTFDEELIRTTLADMTAEQEAWSLYYDMKALPAMLPLTEKGKPDWRCQYCSLAGNCDAAHQVGNKYLVNHV